ncbi:MAG: hypothetical protein ACJ79B_06030 [Gemmatimonadaceae bacterium]
MSGDLQRAFDAALDQVERCLISGMKKADGGSARPQLERLRKELQAECANAIERRAVDREWFQRTVRWVVEWVPDSELTLVASLGEIVRASTPPLGPR